MFFCVGCSLRGLQCTATGTGLQISTTVFLCGCSRHLSTAQQCSCVAAVDKFLLQPHKNAVVLMCRPVPAALLLNVLAKVVTAHQ